MKLKLIKSSDLTQVLDLLISNNLPVSDIQQSNIHLFGYWENETLVGTGGLDIYGENALIRSVSIVTTQQNKGIGSSLIDELETLARQSGIVQLFLLTNTAKDFFLKKGYQIIDRTIVPNEILQTSEFISICPLSATCMMKVLTDNF